MNTATILLILFVLGLVLGSFLSVVIYRIHTGKGGILFGHSACPHCNKKLNPSELIPLFSYIFQMGKCRKCGKKISWHYPVLELSVALVFMAIFAFGFTPLALYLFYGLVLVFIFFYDLLYMEIPDEIIIPSILIALLGTFHPETIEFTDGLIAAGALVAFFLLQILVSKGRWLGGGDLRIGAFIGLILGFKLMLMAVFASYLIGSIISVGLLMSGKVTRKTMIAFGPFLVLGTLTALFYGDPLIDWYLNLLTF